jgi:AcrR family transcriptional regulator
VILAAAKVFERRGYAAATIAQILDEAGVTKGSLYFHFDSKEALAQAVIREQTDWRNMNTEDCGSALERLVALSRSFASALVRDPLVRASIRLTIERTGLGQGELEAYQGWLDAVRELLVQAEEEGDLRESVDPEAAAYVLISAMTGLQLVSEALHHRQDLHARVDDLWRMVLPALTSQKVLARLRTKLSLAV